MSRLTRVVGKAEVARPWKLPVQIVVLTGVVIGVGSLVWFYWPSAPQFNWQRCLRTDADYAIDMPGTPETKVLPQETEFGPTTVQTTQFVMHNPPAVFAVHYSPFPVNSPFQKMSRARAEASLDRFVSLLAGKMDGKLLKQSEVGTKEGFGREFRIEVEGGRVYHGRLLYIGPAQYQLAVLAPQQAETPAYVTKFFKSFEYRGNPP